VSGHVFISYSHGSDGAYVEQMAAYLERAGVPVWFDKEIVRGDQWTRVVREKIDTCAAFVVVMTPEAERSDWVDKEIDRAILMARPIVPLLLRGQRFFTLGNVQYEDVTDSAMPGAGFVSRLRALLPTPTKRDPEPASDAGSDGDRGGAAQAARRGGAPRRRRIALTVSVIAVVIALGVGAWIWTSVGEPGRGAPGASPQSPTATPGPASRDRDVIVSGSSDKSVRVWDAATGQLVHAPLAGHTGPVQAVAIGQVGDHDIIISGSAHAAGPFLGPPRYYREIH
jgi:TIR domain